MTSIGLTGNKLRSTTIALPASKSISNRVLIISALAHSTETINNLAVCDDTSVVVSALRDMPTTIDVHAAGTAMRFLTALMSLTPGIHHLTGTPRMQQRPIRPLVDALLSLGADIVYDHAEGFPPITITGRTLRGGTVTMPGNVSSQYISALMMIAPMLPQGLVINLTGEVLSRSYIDLTMSIMTDFGAIVHWDSVARITIAPQRYRPVHYVIESDWSAASYWYELLALADDPSVTLQLTGLADGSRQGDATIRHIFSLLGIRTTFADRTPGRPTTVTLQRYGTPVHQLTLNFSKCPDIVQTVVCTCCAIGIPFNFTGLDTLRIKETDRLAALQTELRKLGFILHDYNNNQLTWTGERCEVSCAPAAGSLITSPSSGANVRGVSETLDSGTSIAIDTYDDHRMAMAFAPLALTVHNLRINNPEVVTKSYPSFWSHLATTGVTITP